MGEVHYQKYGGTPPQHLLFALRNALDMLLAEGLARAARRHGLLAEATRRAVARWAAGGALAFNITEPAERGNSVTTVLMPGRDPKPLLDYCGAHCGVVVGVGIGELSGKAFRIAHPWATSMRPWCSVSSVQSRWGWPRSASRTDLAGCRPQSTTWRGKSTPRAERALA